MKNQLEVPQVNKSETEFILKCLKEILAKGVSGEIVEMGCYKGDTSVLMAEILRDSNRGLFLYDSFSGLPERSREDRSAAGEQFKAGELLTPKGELVKRFKKMSVRMPTVKKAFFSDLESSDLPDQIAFAFLDGDLYISIRDSLRLILPKMTENSVILIHDYANPALPGVAKAVKEISNIDLIEVSKKMIGDREVRNVGFFDTILKIELK